MQKDNETTREALVIESLLKLTTQLEVKLQSINETTTSMSKKLDDFYDKVHIMDKKIGLLEQKNSIVGEWWKKVISLVVQTAAIVVGAWFLNKLGVAPTSP